MTKTLKYINLDIQLNNFLPKVVRKAPKTLKPPPRAGGGKGHRSLFFMVLKS